MYIWVRVPNMISTKQLITLNLKYGTEANSLQEQLILPYTQQGLTLIKKHGEENLIKKAANIVYDGLLRPQWKNADYTVEDGKQAVILVLNDIQKRALLNSYLKNQEFTYTAKDQIVIICLEEHAQLYKKEYPSCEIETVSMDEIINPII